MKRVEAEKPEPYPKDEGGYEQALAWLRRSQMEDWARAEFGADDVEIGVVVTKVNLMRGCW